MYCYTCMNETDEGGFCRHCGSPLDTQAAPHHLVPGTLLNAKYLIGNFIGEGGFGITYIGKDLNLDIRVAIKEYYPRGFVNRSNDHSNTVSSTIPNSEEFFYKGKKSFLQEARSIAKFPEEEGIVNVRDFFQENNTAYIVMDYLDGENLGKYIRKRGRMEASECISLMVPVMRSLEKFHEAGMIHRDISPDNIMFLKNGSVKLMDFGSARYFANNEREMSVILKQGYSPEEQYRKNGNQGPWTDVYSLCATIYSCITGVKPENALDRCYNDTLRRPSELGISIRADQENALMRGLAVSPENRCKSVAQLMGMLGISMGTENRQPEFGQYQTYGQEEEYGGGMSIPMSSQVNTNTGMGKSVSYAPPKTNKFRPVTVALLIATCICVIFTVVSLTMIVPQLKDGGTETEDTDSDEPEDSEDEEGGGSGDDVADDDGVIDVEELTESEVKKLKNTYWRMNKDDLRKATASSVIKQQQEGATNLPEYLFDNNIQTNWQEGAKGAGIDEFVKYRFQEEYRVCAMSFKLGNWKTKKYYYGNNRPKTLTLTMNGQSWTVSFPDRWEQFGIKFTSPVKTSDLKITIDAVYKGKSWNDTVITDIGVWYE